MATALQKLPPQKSRTVKIVLRTVGRSKNVIPTSASQQNIRTSVSLSLRTRESSAWPLISDPSLENEGRLSRIAEVLVN